QPRCGDRWFPGRDRGRRRFLRVALCHPDRGRTRIRAPGAGGRSQGRARLAARAVPALTQQPSIDRLANRRMVEDRLTSGPRMDAIKVGIIGLGRWAKVLARAAAKSSALEIVSAYSRSQEKRDAFAREFGIATVP